VLAVGIEVQTEADARTGGTYLARASDYKRQSDIDDFTFPALFGRRTKAYLEKYPDISMADIGEVVAKAYANGNKNPLAHMHAKKLSAEKASNGPHFLSNETFRPFLRVTDCSQVSDGGAAAIFMSEEGMRQHGISMDDAVEIIGSDQGAGDLWTDPAEMTELSTTKAVVRSMYRSAISYMAKHIMRY
jgi:acetyl-CoA acyltransferase